jgi:hypothetical protein
MCDNGSEVIEMEEIMDKLSAAQNWADLLMDEEGQDRSMILDGLLEMISDIRDGTPIDFPQYNRRYVRG